jgi:hypothetical protein
MTAKVISLRLPAGVQQDGTLFDAGSWVEAQWVRFQRGKPKKMGGYRALFNNASGVSRGLIMSSVNGLNYVTSGWSGGLQQWTTNNTDGTGFGPIPYALPSTFTVNARNLWQFDIGFDSTGNRANKLVAHAGQNLTDITSTVNTPVYAGLVDSTTLTKVGVFTAVGSAASASTTLTLAAVNTRVFFGQSVSGTNIAANTTVANVVGAVVTLSAATTGVITAGTITFDNNIAVSGGCVVLHPYLFVYGNDGLIQNSSAGDFSNWTASDANANNVAGGKVIKGLPLRGGNNSPAGLFWSTDSLIRVSFSPRTVGGINYYWQYDLLTSQTSIMSSSCVVEYDGIYFWAGVDRFLMYNGTVQEVPNSENMNYFFDNLNYAQRQKVWATKVPRWGEVWFFYPHGNVDECNNAVIYNIREKKWYDSGLLADGGKRSAGYFSEVFRYPIWGDNTQTTLAPTFIGSITGNQLTVSNGTNGLPLLANTLVIGQQIAANGIPANTQILSQSSGTTGGNGIYILSTTSASGVASTVISVVGYSLWQHETGTDRVYLGTQTAINSFIETNSIGFNTGGPGANEIVGDNKFIRLERFEPDFVQSGPMELYVSGKGYADDVDVVTGPFEWTPSTLKIDLREQRREMRLRFVSNTLGGNFLMGRCLLSADMGDERSTGTP